MHNIAQASDFHRLPEEMQDVHIELLQYLRKNNLTCRCEMVGRDFHITVGRGLSSAKYWLDMYLNPRVTS